MEISESLTPDDDVFRFLANKYARLHPTMHMGYSCHDSIKFKDGITNGAAWYQIIGISLYIYIYIQLLGTYLYLYFPVNTIIIYYNIYLI